MTVPEPLPNPAALPASTRTMAFRVVAAGKTWVSGVIARLYPAAGTARAPSNTRRKVQYIGVLLA